LCTVYGCRVGDSVARARKPSGAPIR
jgi:hypothetical protein